MMQAHSGPTEYSRFKQTRLVDEFGQSYILLPKHLSHSAMLGEAVNRHIDSYRAQSLLLNHNSMWGHRFDVNKLYFDLSGDYMANHKSEQQKIAWLSNGIASGEVKVFKGESFATPPPSKVEGGLPVATVPEIVKTRSASTEESLGHGGQSTEDIREALDLYCALPDGSPAASLLYKATLADGTVLKGMLDADGQANIANLEPNNVDVEFGEQPDVAAIAATRAEITGVLNAIIAAERAEGAQVAANYNELNFAQKGIASIGSLLTGLAGALADTAEFSYNLIKLGSLQGQLKRALNAGWDAYNVDDDKGWAESFASNWSTNQHQAYVKALGFDPASITKQKLAEAYEIASFISDDSEIQAALVQFVKDFAKAQHHTELTEMGGAAIFDIVLSAILVALSGGTASAAIAVNRVRHLDKLGGLFKKLAKQLKQKARFKTKSGRTGGKVEQQIAKPAGVQVPTDAGKQKSAVPPSHSTKFHNIESSQVEIKNFKTVRQIDLENLSEVDAIAASLLEKQGWPDRKIKEVLSSGENFRIKEVKAGDKLYGFNTKGFEKDIKTSAYWMDEAGLQQMKSKHYDGTNWDHEGVKNSMALPCFNRANIIEEVTVTKDQKVVESTIGKATELIQYSETNKYDTGLLGKIMPGGGTQIAADPATLIKVK